MKLGLQLYSIGDEMDKNFDLAIEKVAKIGYDGVEFAGYGGKTAKELKSALLTTAWKSLPLTQTFPTRKKISNPLWNTQQKPAFPL